MTVRAVTDGHFVVDFSEPRTTQGRPWNANVSIDVVCDTAERAIELVRQRHPDARVHVVRRVGGRAELLIDTPSTPQADQVRAWLDGKIHMDHDTFAMGRDFAAALIGDPSP